MAVFSNSTALPVAKALRPKDASNFTFEVIARTHLIGGSVYNMIYAKELVTVDPLGELEDDCLVVMVLYGGTAFMIRISATGRDFDGRFLKRGDPAEVFQTHSGISFCRADLGKHAHIVGRVVGDDRVFPLSLHSRSTSLHAGTPEIHS